MNNSNKYLSVSALNKYLYYKFDNDLNLRSIYLKAEISNIRLSKGILYFVLKDNESEINGLMYAQTLQKLKFEPKDGMTVLVNGKVGLYFKRGNYAITVTEMEQAGLGEAYLKFQFIKEKLMNEGLFDEEKKLSIPKYNQYIGVITSSTGDAVHDIVSTINRRFPLSQVIFYPAIVQGEDAPKSLIKAINKANVDAVASVLIIARGGGSIEDLSCFNDEELARTIFNSKIPTISGVGHEADFTICDFVSSRRAPTPTGAAVIATPDKNELFLHIENQNNRLKSNYKQILINKYNQFKNLNERYNETKFLNQINVLNNQVINYTKQLELLSPSKNINDAFNSLLNLDNKIDQSYNKLLNNFEIEINHYIDKLIILNPLNLMKKGYAIVYKEKNVISSINSVDENDNIDIKLQDGSIKAKVIEKRN